MDALETGRLLLIDTCGETAGVAVCVGSNVLATEDLSRGGASAEIVAVVRKLLAGIDWKLGELDAVGVASGPGSFTGMRTGLAAAKGFCEAAGLRLVGVSRLAVLASAAGVTGGLVALDAGRGQVYVREVVSGKEWLCGDEELLVKAHIAFENDKQTLTGLVVAEERVAGRLAAGKPVMRALHVGDALNVVLQRLAEDASSDGVVDANYVRGEDDIYRKAVEPTHSAKATA